MGGGAQQRKDGARLPAAWEEKDPTEEKQQLSFTPHHKAIHLSLSQPHLHASDIPFSPVTVPPLEHRVSACECVSLCAGPLRGHRGSPQPSVPLRSEAPLSRTNTPVWGAWCGAGVPHSSGGKRALKIFLLILHHHMEVWGPKIFKYNKNFKL